MQTALRNVLDSTKTIPNANVNTLASNDPWKTDVDTLRFIKEKEVFQWRNVLRVLPPARVAQLGVLAPDLIDKRVEVKSTNPIFDLVAKGQCCNILGTCIANEIQRSQYTRNFTTPV